VRESMRWGRG